MVWFLFSVWLGFGVFMGLGVLDISRPFVTANMSVVIGLVSYGLGSAMAAACYEFCKFVDYIRNKKLATARFGEAQDVKDAGLRSNTGVIVGRRNGRTLRYNKPGHLISISKTRGGKGVSAVIPNLLDHQGSVLCVDVKGENHSITARHRRKFGPVYTLSPFGASSAQYNPLDFIRRGSDEIDDAALVASLIVVPDGVEDSFWENEAKSLITGLILYVIRHQPVEKRNLSEVRRLLTQGADDFDETLLAMINSPHWWIRRSAAAFSQKAERERSAVISTAQSHTRVFDSPRLGKVTARSSFQLEDLKKRNFSLYVIVPPYQLVVYRPWVRLMVGLAQAAMTRDNHKSKHPVLFLLDEFPALGRMPIDGFAYLSGYGVRLWVFTQSFAQLDEIYGKGAETIIANCAVQQVWSLAPADYVTAERISKTLGEKAIKIGSSSKSSHFRFLPLFYQFNESMSQRTRRLLTADEILCLPENSQLLFVTGSRPFLTKRVKYFADWRFSGKFDEWTEAQTEGEI